MPHAPIPDDIGPELIAGRSNDVNQGNIDHSQQFRPSESSGLIAHENDQYAGQDLSHGKEELMIPLEVKVIVPVIEVTPPSVVMGVDRGQ